MVETREMSGAHKNDVIHTIFQSTHLAASASLNITVFLIADPFVRLTTTKTYSSCCWFGHFDLSVTIMIVLNLVVHEVNEYPKTTTLSIGTNRRVQQIVYVYTSKH